MWSCFWVGCFSWWYFFHTFQSLIFTNFPSFFYSPNTVPGKRDWIWSSIIKCWKWSCYCCWWCCPESSSLELKQRSTSMRSALCLLFVDIHRTSADETAWTMKAWQWKMSICLNCTNGASGGRHLKQTLQVVKEFRRTCIYFLLQFLI